MKCFIKVVFIHSHVEKENNVKETIMQTCMPIILALHESTVAFKRNKIFIVSSFEDIKLWQKRRSDKGHFSISH